MLKRQGDILLERIEGSFEFTQNQIVADGVIALGETTGHAHKVEGGTLVQARGVMAVLSTGEAKVVHEEHDEIELEDGIPADRFVLAKET